MLPTSSTFRIVLQVAKFIKIFVHALTVYPITLVLTFYCFKKHQLEMKYQPDMKYQLQGFSKLCQTIKTFKSNFVNPIENYVIKNPISENSEFRTAL